MQETSRPTAQGMAAVWFTLAVFAAVTLVFGAAFALTSSAPAVPAASLAADTYLDTVNTLLANADPANGALLVAQHGCIVCHRTGAPNGIAPAFTGLADRAATRRPPLTAAAYIYEAIINPGVFTAHDGSDAYASAMPQNFAQILTPQEIGDIVAYLLTPDAH